MAAPLYLPVQVKILTEQIPRGEEVRHIRRAVLINKEDGSVYELATTFIYREHKANARNTHMTAARDLALFLTWLHTKERLRKNWKHPEARLLEGRQPLTEAEVANLGEWCQEKATAFTLALQHSNSGIPTMPLGTVVAPSTINSRLRYIRDYLIWLTKQFIANDDFISDTDLARAIRYEENLKKYFNKQFVVDGSADAIRSLDEIESRAVSAAIKGDDVYSASSCGIRDKLIVGVLQQGLRAGELLKLETNDVHFRYRTKNGYVPVVSVIRRPNDSLDSRLDEPAVKTKSGNIAIPTDLAEGLLQYISGPRRMAMDSSTNITEHPYLFVCHLEGHQGKPISRRNLNRIVAKLNAISELSSDLTPHVLRHTHFTELANAAEEKGRSATEIRALLISRGRWTKRSDQPDRYTNRRTRRLEEELVAERERKIAN